MRNNTERPEAVLAGTVVVVGTSRQGIVEQTKRLLKSTEAYLAMKNAVNPYGDGQASRRVAEGLLHYFGRRDERPAEWVV